MKEKKIMPYGEWPSPITAELFANLTKISEPGWLSDGSLVWRERVSGQTSLERIDIDTGEIKTVSGNLNIGGQIMYGGGGYSCRGEELFGFDQTSHQLFRIIPKEDLLEKLTSEIVTAANPQISPDGNYTIFIHSDGDEDAIYAQDNQSKWPPTALISGADFYNYPRWSPDGMKTAWISWDHPSLPWESSQLWLGDLVWDEAGIPELASSYLAAGGKGISVLQPEFTPDGKYLIYVSDQDGWWQIYKYDLYSGKSIQITDQFADHGLPPWLQNQKAYLITPDSKDIVFLRNKHGIRSLWMVDLEGLSESQIKLDLPFTWLEDPALSPDGQTLALIASGAKIPPTLITTTLAGKTRVIRKTFQSSLPDDYFSNPEPINWPGQDGGKVHGLYYPPTHPEIRGAGKPPLLVIIHSGPTRQKWIDFQPRTQFFSSRGIAILEVNYRGSTGYGRAYWEALRGKWGLLDVDDCYSGAVHCAETGLADPDRMVVMGSSSGGLAVFQILTNYPGTFRGGISLSGIVNHLSLLENPPKFEKYYSDWLIGPYPEKAMTYRERSPIFSADRIQEPVAIFQGAKDRIVPPDQAEQIIGALERNDIPYLYRLYPEEGHSFKKIETLADFYSRIELFLQKHILKG